MDAELQQRGVEFGALFKKHDSMRYVAFFMLEQIVMYVSETKYGIWLVSFSAVLFFLTL